jgi:TonB family protein
MNLLLWMLYAVVVGGMVALAAWILEWALGRHRGPLRWVWVGAITLAVGIPLVPLTPLAPFLALAPGSESAPQAGIGSPEDEVGLALGSIERASPGGLSRSARLTRFTQLTPGALPGVAQVAGGIQRGLGAVARALDPAARWSPALAWGWGGGSLLTLLLLVVGRTRLARARRTWVPARLLGRDVLLAPDHGPAVVGIRSPRIVLPVHHRGLPAGDLQMILDHEEEHLKAGDPLLVAAAAVPLVLFPWNPALWWSINRLRTAIEVDCDRRVLARGIGPSAYGGLLVRLGVSPDPATLPMLSLAGFPSSLERRLKAMKRTQDWKTLPLSLSAGSVALAVLLLACTASPPEEVDAGVEAMGGEAGATPALTGALMDLDPDAPVTVMVDPQGRPILGSVTAEGTRGVSPGVRPLDQVTLPEGLPASRGAQDTTSGARRLSDGPSFTPFTVAPQVMNRPDVVEALEREYPAILRDAGIGGTALLYFFLNAEGGVQDVRVNQSSGHPGLDEAALRVARVYRFSAARNRDQAVPVWIQIPVSFTNRSDAESAARPTPPPTVPSDSIRFTPFTRAPEVTNRSVVARALEREYPPALRDAGIGGAVIVFFFIDAEGVVRDARVHQTSGFPALDQAALRVAQIFEFTPAFNREQAVPVWIQIPITFTTR